MRTVSSRAGEQLARLRIPIRGYETGFGDLDEILSGVTNPYKGLWGFRCKTAIIIRVSYESL